jgi:hypothetical protein
MPIMSFNSRLGLAIETTWGTPVTTPKVWVPVKSNKIVDEVKRILDSGRRGNLSKDFESYAGITTGSADLDGDVYPDIEGYILKGLFGQDNVTGSSAPYTHAFTLSTAQPPSFTLFDYDGYNERILPGAVIESVDYKFTVEGELSRQVKFLSKASTVSSQVHTATFGTTPPFLGWQASLQIAGAPNTRMVGGNIQFKRATKLTFGANNSQQPSKANVGQMEVTGKLDFEIDDYTELNYYLQATKPSVVITFTSGADSLTFQLSKCDFEKVDGLDRSQEMVRVSANIRGLYNTTDQGPAQVTLVSSVDNYN